MHFRYFTALAFTATLFAAERFDMQVRNDFFAGFTGDKAAMDRAMAKTETVLAANPKHAEALVWHGGALMTTSRQAFQSGDTQKGMELFTRGQKEMDEGVAIEPDNVAVRIPRGAILMAVGRGTLDRNPELGKRLLSTALGDYQHVYEMQKSSLSDLGQHPMGELLFGIADTNSRLGNQQQAAEFFDRIATLLPNTAYAKRAAMWQESKSLPLSQTGCVGCHTTVK